MPVTEPDSFKSLNLIPFQINPHFLDANPEDHAGETREQRIMEFIEINPSVPVLGLREGTMLLIEGGEIKLIGAKNARLFLKGANPIELDAGRNLSFLMK
jgi:dipeptidase E